LGEGFLMRAVTQVSPISSAVFVEGPRQLAQRKTTHGRRRRNGRCAPSIPNRVSIHQRPTKAHLRSQFWNIVRSHITNYEQPKSWLREHGVLLEQDI